MLRFMFVGDSMTIGSAGEHTWRHRMWQHLLATLGDTDFAVVGPRRALHDKVSGEPVSYDYACTDPAFPRHHFAGWGEGWLHMAPQIADAVRRDGADVLLVSLGLIDLGFYTNAEQTAQNMRAFVTQARSANPRIRLVLLPVIPNIRARTDAPFAAEVARFNVLLAKAVADLDTGASPLLLASAPPSYDIDVDTYDGTHPGESGEHKLAAAFADAMHQAWGLGAPYAPTPLPLTVPVPVPVNELSTTG
ncbi:GDSL-type esterase/lipase family protein [Streptomyces durmitorensis]|uniref:GDSL-type esterase/lipase family protein n=1 Tax=Streptomyces durmitorensis TaxID=319947 RepID=A0ABY4PWP9_9ACTN|nr:GDSL-type esterase/lipase family protein [Streptomyces durmitorensis]UQT57877.1 GDSL-type esterase/lipase family protein [Streptomyces durmitorensis]